ncbi:YsnF/AvaK domain-containing protein [Catenulispora sp. NF23]|uniref:YsnF/AvaK domain-containing protein n=1 Tax=Catenulispora pinistramenti TaxID=2705254 RepID=A0ABS5KL54_9ACTN|nr:YsnF/AvaK domain-containing protein [Catenulispora pinistramenti]MBS2531503.1 YsnF/AvaK domain-containing protein [Catenulispora pinistramenti]MBS2546772.1 YsnF/AvaK domain-containing protein [Catenulispora pinistramenti]
MEVDVMTGREQFLGKQMVGRDGQEIGAIDRVFVNDITGEPDWATVRIGVLRREHVVPLEGAQLSGDAIRVPHFEATIKNSPKLDFDDHLGPEDVAALAKHYGTTAASPEESMNGGSPQRTEGQMRSRAAAETGGQTRQDVRSGTSGDMSGGTSGERTAENIQVPQDLHREATLDATRYGERLHVAKENREAGRVRLRKYAEQTPVEQRVELHHETYEVVRVAIDDPAQGPGKHGDWSEQVEELVLFDEQVHATKEVVPLERIVIRKKVISEEKVIRDTVRTEQFEIIEPDSARGRAGVMGADKQADKQAMADEPKRS